MDSSDGIKNEEQDEQPGYDLERLKWIDPCCDERFTRKELETRQGGSGENDVSSEKLLENIVRLTDDIFDHLSVFEQFSETTSRGAIADAKKKLDLLNV